MEQPSAYSCPTCGDEFATPQQLTLHRRENHPQQAERPDTPQLQLQGRLTAEEHGEVF